MKIGILQTGDTPEALSDHGTYPDVPHAYMISLWRAHYPAIRSGAWRRAASEG